MTAPDERALAASHGAMLQTIPNARKAIAVTSTATAYDLAAVGSPAVDLRGKWIFFATAPGSVDVRFMRGNHAATLDSNKGGVAKAGEMSLPFYVDPSLGTSITFVSASNVSMDILYDDGA